MWALEYIHKEVKVVHWDIKPSNILVDERDKIKLADFGASIQGCDLIDPHQCMKEGSPYYFAPEIFGKEKLSGQKADIWALGVTLY